MDLIIDIGSEASLKLFGKEFLIPNLYEKILYELSKDYNTLKLTIFNEDSGLSELIKSKSNVIEIKELEKSTFKEYIYLILNKPTGYISATEDRTMKTVLDLVPQEYLHRSLFPAGR